MSERGHQLARSFDQVTNRLVETIRTVSDEEWAALGEEDGWSVAQEALHIAVWMEIEADWMSRLAAGKRIVPHSRETIDALNARLVAEVPEPTREQVLLEIAGGRSLVRHFLISLNDKQLDRSLPMQDVFLSADEDRTMTITEIVEILPWHVEHHLGVINRTLKANGQEIVGRS